MRDRTKGKSREKKRVVRQKEKGGGRRIETKRGEKKERDKRRERVARR